MAFTCGLAVQHDQMNMTHLFLEFACYTLRRFFFQVVFCTNKCCFALVMGGGGSHIPLGPQNPINVTIIQDPHQ